MIKNFVKAHDREGQAYTYLRNKFSILSEAEVKKQIFIDPLITELIHKPELGKTLRSEAAWNTFKSLCIWGTQS